MLRAQLLRLARRMQRVGEEQEAVRQFRRGSGQHARLASAVGVAAQEYAALRKLAHGEDRVAKPLAVALRATGAGRAVRRRLAVRQVAAQDEDARLGEG